MSSRVNLKVSDLNIASTYYNENLLDWTIYYLMIEGVKLTAGYSFVSFTSGDITKLNNLMQKCEMTILNDDGAVEKYILSDYITLLKTSGITKKILGGHDFRQEIDKDILIRYKEYVGIFELQISYETDAKYMFDVNKSKKPWEN